MNKAGDNMAVFNVVVIVRPVNVRGDDAGKVAAVLLVVSTTSRGG